MTKISTYTLQTPPCKGTITYKTQKSTISLLFDKITPAHKSCTKCIYSTYCALLNPLTQKALLTPALPQQPKEPKMDTTDFPTVPVQAFTGMQIGSLPIVEDTLLTLTVLTGKQVKLVFDKRTGTQTNASNPHFANRIAPQTPQDTPSPLASASTQPEMS